MSSHSYGEGFGVAKGNVFTFRLRAEPETLDWNRAGSIVASYVLMNLMEGLVSLDSSLKVVPALSESWTLSADRKTYTFKIRSGVKWSDGVPLKAKDFLFSWKRLISPLTASTYAYLLNDIEGAEEFSTGKIKDFNKVGIKAIGDSVFQVKLKKPVAHWLLLPAFWVTFPLRQDIVDKYGDGWASPGRMVNLGPYSLVAFDHGSKIIMKANPSYYGKRGNLDQITAVILSDDHAAFELYEAGKLDYLTDLSTADSKKIKTRADLKIFPQFKTAFLAFVVNKYPTLNLKLRRAIAMSIDKSKFSDVLSGGQTPASTFVPPGLAGYSKEMGLPFYPKKARLELAASGLDTTVALKIDYMYRDWEKAQKVAEFVRSQLKENLGIEVILRPFENKSFQTQRDLHTFPMFDYTWTADYPDADNFLSVFLGDSGNDKTGWKNAGFDQMIELARTTADPKARKNLYLKMQKQLIEDEVVIVPLYYQPNLVLVQPRVKNFEVNPLDYLYLRKVNVVP